MAGGGRKDQSLKRGEGLSVPGIPLPRGMEIRKCDEQAPFTYFEWVFEKLMHNPPDEELEGLLPEAWIKTQKKDPAAQSGDAA